MRPIVSLRESLSDPDLLGHVLHGPTWKPHRVLLLAAFGEELTDDERTLFRAFTDRESEPGKCVSEFCVVAGRRTGKTSGLMSAAATYISGLCDFRDVLAPAETGTFLCLAQDQRTAKQVLDYVETHFMRSKILRPRFVRRTQDTIELTNNITIEVRPANSARLRGITLIGISADEMAHWFVDDTYANPDTQVLGAVRPAMLTTKGMLFMASSPWGRRGVLWDTYNKHFGPKGKPNILVAKGTTVQFNPNISQEIIDAELERDPELNRAEYLAEFRSDLEAYVRLEAVEACISRGWYEREPLISESYVAFDDPSTGSGEDSWALAISHAQRNNANNVTVDLVREWRPPFSAEAVIKEICDLCRQYRCYKITSDRTGKWTEERFTSFGGVTREITEKNKHDLYVGFLPVLNSGCVELLDHPRSINQLLSLERSRTKIDHPPRGHDDLINAIAGSVDAALGKYGAYLGGVAGYDRWCN
jgi:hypothetical protein